MKKVKDEELAMIINNRTYDNYYDRLKLIATSLFTWEGLDEIGGNSRFLEQSLFELGKACFIKDEKLGYMTLKANPANYLNNYNLPTEIEAYSINYHKIYKLDEIVYIMNNEMQMPTSSTIELMAYRLYEAQRTIDVNISSQKTPILLEGDTKSILALKNAYMQYSGNMPVLFSKKDFDIGNKVNCVKTDAPFIVDKLELHKHEIMNECLTFLGINNANTDKKERLITDEVNSNNNMIAYCLNTFYKTRKKACDEINKKFFNGKEQVKIVINNDLTSLLNIDKNDIIEGVEDNG